MRAFKDLYNAISYSLLIVQIGFVGVWVYNKTVYHRVLNYGSGEDPETISGNYFGVLKFLLYTSLVLMIAWALLTPFALISKKQNLRNDYREVAIGSLAFIMSVILLIIDPFGIFKWFTSQV